MRKFLTACVQRALRAFGVKVVPYRPDEVLYPPDFDQLTKRICDAVVPFTMTSVERVNAVVEAVRYIVVNNIDGAMVECGVWKGGSVMAMALALQAMGDKTREIYLYDTFCGMSSPTEVDVSIRGKVAQEVFAKTPKLDVGSVWCVSPLEEVRENVLSTGYPSERFHFVKGKVEDTIPAHVPQRIALLRLDTDWYESTKHELTHLFPLISQGGVITIDDYGHWKGARQAVDEYISENHLCIFLSRIDYTGRITVKIA